MIYVYQEYKVRIKMGQEQQLQLKIKFLIVLFLFLGRGNFGKTLKCDSQKFRNVVNLQDIVHLKTLKQQQQPQQRINCI